MSAKKSNKSIVMLCGGLTLGMLAMSFAAVPLYQIFCQVTGYGGTIQRAEYTTGQILDKKIRVRFDANISNALDWSFEPTVEAINVNIGEQVTVNYRAKNISSDESSGTATFNVSPHQAGYYFNKIECFCFTQQTLKAGEEVIMPVTFFVDPDIINDETTKNLDDITLSYTFFQDQKDKKIARK